MPTEQRNFNPGVRFSRIGRAGAELLGGQCRGGPSMLVHGSYARDNYPDGPLTMAAVCGYEEAGFPVWWNGAAIGQFAFLNRPAGVGPSTPLEGGQGALSPYVIYTGPFRFWPPPLGLRPGGNPMQDTRPYTPHPMAIVQEVYKQVNRTIETVWTRR